MIKKFATPTSGLRPLRGTCVFDWRLLTWQEYEAYQAQQDQGTVVEGLVQKRLIKLVDSKNPSEENKQ